MPSVADEIIDYGATLDFQLREAYELSLHATEEQLHLAFGKYTRPAPRSEWIPCGLNGCDEPHRYGFVIRLHDGRETHCGPDCGEKHFGAKWTEVISTVKAAEEAAATRSAVAALLVERDALVARGVQLAKQSRDLENRVLAASGYLSSAGYGMSKAIENCAREGGSIRAEVNRGATGLAAAGRPRSAQIYLVATIDGIELLTRQFVNYARVIESTLPGLSALDAAMLSGATQKDLAKRSKEGQQFVGTLERAERQLRRGERLFEAGNLRKFEQLVEHKLRSDDITPRLRKALDDLYAMANPSPLT